MLSSRLIEQLHWYLAKPDVGLDADRVTAGGALAIIGAPIDDIAGFADRIAPERPVLDLRHVRPSANEVAALRTRPHEAMKLLRQAVAQLGVVKPLEDLGHDVMAGLHAYRWPRGLHELREASWRIGACLDGGTARQALARYLERRMA